MTTLRNDRGLTLLELLIAVALLAVVAAALYGTFFTVIKGRDRATSGMEQRRELGQTLDRLRREISSAFVRRSLDPKQDTGFFLVEDRDVFGKPASTLFFTAFTVPPADEGVPRSDQMRVRYRVVERGERLRLTREESDILQDVTTTPYPQMEELDAFLVECYDGSKWVKTWHTDLTRKLPALVRITIRTTEQGQPAEYTATIRPRLGS